MKIKSICFLMLVVLCTACSKMEEDSIAPSVSGEMKNFTLNAIYAGREYHVPCILDVEADSIIFLDEGFKNLFYDEISKLPNLVCDVINDSTVEYKNEIIEVPEFDNMQEHPSNVTRSSADETYVQFYTDSGYKGASMKISLRLPGPGDLGYLSWQHPNMTPIGFGKNISSLVAYNRNAGLTTADVYLLAYDQMLFKGHVLRYQLHRRYPEATDHSFVELPDLSQVPMDGGSNWNDKIMSMKFYLQQ